MDPLTHGFNTGLIEVAPNLSTDFMAGGETGIVEQIRNVSGDWLQYASPGKWQKLMGVWVPNNNGFNTEGCDFLNCVSCSANDELQTFGNWLVLNGMSDNALAFLRENGYFDANGKLNFSNRFTAKMSKTTMNGNSLPNVAQSIRTYGLVPEAMMPMVTADEINANPANWWNIYYSDPSPEALALGKKFLEYFDMPYEWVAYPGGPADPKSVLEQQLQFSPLQIATAVCAGWNSSGPINGCGAGCQHATELLKEADAGSTILDHYEPFVKLLGANYGITYVMRQILVEKMPVESHPFRYTYTKNLVYGSQNNDPIELHALQEGLQALNYMRAGVFGPFGPQTRTALAAFQRANGISDNGTHFGPRSRAAMNRFLS